LKKTALDGKVIGVGTTSAPLTRRPALVNRPLAPSTEGGTHGRQGQTACPPAPACGESGPPATHQASRGPCQGAPRPGFRQRAPFPRSAGGGRPTFLAPGDSEHHCRGG